MQFHWYWPFARPEELEWAAATAREGESVLVQVVDRDAAPEAGTLGPVTVVRDLPDVDRDRSNRVVWAASRGGTYLARARARRARWRHDHFDLVHLHYVNRFTDAFVPLARPLVMSVHDVVPHTPRLGARVEHRLLARLYRRADALVVHHGELGDRLANDFGVDPNRIHTVAHQVFPVGGELTDPSPGAPTVLFFGALRPNKGLAVLAEAMRHLRGDELRLVIAGRGDAAEHARASRLADDDPRVTVEADFVPLERKRQLFGDAAVVVMPYTTFASQSGVLHDAYGHGRPVVVSNVGALGTSVDEDGTGLVVPPNDPAALAEAIRRVLEPEIWNVHAAAARRISEERSPTVTGARLREVYDHVLG